MTWFTALVTAVGIIFLLVAVGAVVRVYPRLESVERLALWWWAAIAVVAAAGFLPAPRTS